MNSINRITAEILPPTTTQGLKSREREKTATYARVGSTVGGGLVGILVMPAVIFFSAKATSTGDDRGWFVEKIEKALGIPII